ncbi:dihydroxyacetone kinase subunit DhaK [Bradyrhizobium ottawaense]|uniref:Dihydroxyacetone kinase n=1 Tax=Bradyrhizobium ottawaense TaxID=931866 RepID=A0A2U8PGL7_9BRAD|nr:dihydroxyacetone kinase subunit DhaK [Bradyrhizobium ottawaense]AWL96876.1 dihydroxyacetone kinase [Bradyrhizobium ottawaense]MBR1325985.1 dihydroxyacetone kinase subunit DhaK [Bradyrhizobium ottawaense]
MKKLMNSPDAFVDEMLAGLIAAHPSLVQEGRVVRRAGVAKKGKVGIVSGGGSGHLPLFTGYVGDGLLDTCAIGDVFAGPSVDSCIQAIRAADGGAGVLRLYGNYGGDRMNFDLAGEMVEMDGIETTTVRGTDDIASAAPQDNAKRRGVAGIIYAYKIAGAKADTGAGLADVTATAQAAVDACRTIGVALSPCQIPGAAKPTFELGADEIEMGMGIHGEPGIWRDKLRPADEVADEMVRRLLADPVAHKSERVSVLVNSLGATPLEELFIVYRRVAALLKKEGLTIVRPLVGHYVTSMEMAGLSISMIHLDAEREQLLAAPCACPFWRV